MLFEKRWLSDKTLLLLPDLNWTWIYCFPSRVTSRHSSCTRRCGCWGSWNWWRWWYGGTFRAINCSDSANVVFWQMKLIRIMMLICRIHNWAKSTSNNVQKQWHHLGFLEWASPSAWPSSWAETRNKSLPKQRWTLIHQYAVPIQKKTVKVGCSSAQKNYYRCMQARSTSKVHRHQNEYLHPNSHQDKMLKWAFDMTRAWTVQTKKEPWISLKI